MTKQRPSLRSGLSFGAMVVAIQLVSACSAGTSPDSVDPGLACEVIEGRAYVPVVGEEFAGLVPSGEAMNGATLLVTHPDGTTDRIHGVFAGTWLVFDGVKDVASLRLADLAMASQEPLELSAFGVAALQGRALQSDYGSGSVFEVDLKRHAAGVWIVFHDRSDSDPWKTAGIARATLHTHAGRLTGFTQSMGVEDQSGEAAQLIVFTSSRPLAPGWEQSSTTLSASGFVYRLSGSVPVSVGDCRG